MTEITGKEIFSHIIPQILDKQSSLDFWCEFTTPIHVSAAVIVFAGYSIGEVMRNEMGGVRKTWLLREDEERWRRVYRYSEA